jgi:hypothetical protein
VDARCGDLEMALLVSLGWSAFEDPAVGVDEGQALALELREAGLSLEDFGHEGQLQIC